MDISVTDVFVKHVYDQRMAGVPGEEGFAAVAATDLECLFAED